MTDCELPGLLDGDARSQGRCQFLAVTYDEADDLVIVLPEATFEHRDIALSWSNEDCLARDYIS